MRGRFHISIPSFWPRPRRYQPQYAQHHEWGTRPDAKCTPDWHVWDKREQEGTFPRNGESCDCGGATWPV